MTRSVVDRFWSKTVQTDGCWLWTGAVNKERAVMSVGGRAGAMVQASRISWTIANGPIPDGAQVLHDCDNGMCVNPAHLHLGDHPKNMAEMSYRRRVPQTKLFPSDVVRIRELLAAGRSGASIAREYGVVKSTIYWIKDGGTWRSVDDEGKLSA